MILIAFPQLLLRAFKLIPHVIRQLGQLVPTLLLIWRAIVRRIKLTRRGEWPQNVPSSRCCFHVPDVYIRPDPLIYAQHYLLARGLAVTWDNPDIQLFDHGAPVSSATLLPNRDYEVRVRIWNGSYDAPALGVGVTLSFLSFGIATTSTPVGATSVNLGAKGTPDCPVFATFNWRTPPVAGHYCLQAALDWHDDANPDNNLGQENVNVGIATSPATFTFRLRNAAAVRRRFVLEADTYAIPAQGPCDDDYQRQFGDIGRFPSRLAESRAHWAWALRRLPYGAFRVPDDWSISITPSERVLDGGEESEIAVAIEPRDPGFRGRRAFNVHGFTVSERGERTPVGGVTLEVQR